MKTIDINELNIIHSNYDKGNFSTIHLVNYDGKEYCLKIFNPYEYSSEIIDNIGNLTEQFFSKEFITPKYIVLRKDRIIGYITLLKKNKEDIYTKDIKKKILLLKDAKNKIQKLHNEYKLIHGDLNVNNILFDKKSASIIDFDSALYFDQTINNTISLSNLVLNYLKYFKYNYKVDIYRFNLTTIKILNNILLDDELIKFLKNDQNISNENIKKLSKELLLNPEDIKKEYSGKYLIDYL